jgi:hypothetical protein
VKDERLRELADECLVRVGADLENAPIASGSGVWIAPGIVLTCAHVVPDGAKGTAEVGWNERIYLGTVIEHVPNPQRINLWPSPDIALIRVREALDHPCVWLSEAMPGEQLVALGHSDPLREGLLPASIDVDRGGVQLVSKGRYWQLKSNEITKGMSGGPVLDVGSGAVCGVTTATIGVGADRGGYVVPIESLRLLNVALRKEILEAHDRFHGADHRWTSLRAELDGRPTFGRIPLTAVEETQLLALLADFPQASAPELSALLLDSSQSERVVKQSPTALRDVAYALLDHLGDSADSTMPILRMVHRLVGTDTSAGVEQDLYDWATAVAGRVGAIAELQTIRKQEAVSVPNGGLVSIEIVPGAAQIDQYRLTVSIERRQHRRHPMYQNKNPELSIEQVREVVCDQLRIALDLLEGNAEIEFVVPIELFNEPFDELAPMQEWTNVGRQFRVVLRDFDRRRSRATHHQWQHRWQRWLQPTRDVRWIACDEDLTAGEFAAELEQHSDIAGVLLARPPDTSTQAGEMLKVALDAGIPVAVWRRAPCSDHDAFPEGDDCPGKRFQVTVDPLMRAEHSAELPESVRQLRIKMAGREPDPTDLECRGIVLLFDDPARAIRPVAPVHAPLEIAI